MDNKFKRNRNKENFHPINEDHWFQFAVLDEDDNEVIFVKDMKIKSIANINNGGIKVSWT